jgi:Rrf2 family iron-sulfur cluster assembly transcriptional regulator
MLSEIAAAQNLPRAFLGKILKDLVHTGMLRSARGPAGGYSLAREPKEISLLEIKEAVEGRGDLERCAVGLSPCSDDSPCPLHDTYKPLRTAITAYLKDTTLAGLAAGLSKKQTLLGDRPGRSSRRPDPATT